MELNTIAKVILTIIIIVISVLLIYSVGSRVRGEFPIKIKEVLQNFFRTIFKRGPYNICEAYSERQLSEAEFETLLLATYHGQCGNASTSITLDFSLSEQDIEDIAEMINIAKKGELIFYNLSEPLGAGALIIDGNPGLYPIKKWDRIVIQQEGYPEPDVLMKVTIQGCDPYDDDCDLMCSFKEGICDPVCYKNGLAEDVLCDIDCVDKNGNGRIDEGDLDGVCDLDCYNDVANPGRAYDPDCVSVKEEYGFEDICDPDSNGVSDSLCDPKCAERNFHCDPDCDGVVDEGNPGGLLDDDCYTCDGTCNNYCSPVCAKDEDPDCEDGYDQGLTECCGNGVCGEGEDCGSCGLDCPVGNSCEDFDAVCCSSDPSRDEYGCSQVKDVPEGGSCYCSSQCSDDLGCDDTGHCCPTGKEWDGTGCITIKKFKIVAVAVNYDDMDAYKNRAVDRMQRFTETSPFRECPSTLDIEILDKNCNCPHETNPQDCAPYIFSCVDQDVSDYDLVAGFSDYPMMQGYSIWPTPFVICYGDIPEGLDRYCFAHELGHQFKLCDEYRKAIFNSQNSRFSQQQWGDEFRPYRGCNNPYPSNDGIGPPNVCNIDCSQSSSSCSQGTCGHKLGGTSPPYDTCVMGGGANLGSDLRSIVGIPTGFGSVEYQNWLEMLQESGYCK